MKFKSLLNISCFYLFLFSLVLLLNSCTGEKTYDLDSVKSATVFIKLIKNKTVHQGSGLLFKKEGNTGYIVTNAHVLGEIGDYAKSADVVFYSGSINESECKAEVLGVSHAHDVAVLKVVSDMLPEPISMRYQSELHENLPVYILEFPLGKDLSLGEGNPVVTVSKGTISSIRKDDQGTTNMIQIDGEVHPGNSGGPIIDLDGGLVGITVAKIDSVQTTFALPGLTIRDMMRGAVSFSRLSHQEISTDQAVISANFQLFDPFKNIENLSILIAPAMKIKFDLTPNSSQKTRKKVSKNMISYPLPYSILKSKTIIPLDKKHKTGITNFIYMIEFTSKNGNIHYTEPTKYKLGSEKKKEKTKGKYDSKGLDSSSEDMEVETINLSSTIYDVASGGWGRYLVLHLKEVGKLAVIDLTDPDNMKYIPAPSNNIIYAAGAYEVVIIEREHNILLRYDLATVKRQWVENLDVDGSIKLIAMGSGAENTALTFIADESERYSTKCDYYMMDVLKGKVQKLEFGRRHYRSSPCYHENMQIRASSNAKTYSFSNSSYSSGAGTIVISGGIVKDHYLNTSSGVTTPGPNGDYIYTKGKVFTSDAKEVLSHLDKSYIFIPSNKGNLFLGVLHKKKNRRKTIIKSFDIFLKGHEAPLIQISAENFSDIDLEKSSQDNLTADKRFHLVADEGVLAYIPKTNNKIITVRFNMKKIMDDSKQNYLFVTSTPPSIALRGRKFKYNVKVQSKKGGVDFDLDSAPDGMAIDSKGKITWDVSSVYERKSYENVVVIVKDDSGKLIFHTFEIQVK
jgi:trypsin-like peptidase